MCFSASASFGAAAILGGVGVATLAQRPDRKRLAFALIPLIFAVHQLIEGFVWLSIASGAPPDSLVIAYLLLAQVFWPAYTPLSILLLEDDARRRLALWLLLAVGLVVSAALATILLTNEYTVRVVRHSLRYATDHQFEDRLVGLYLVAVATPLLISRYRYIIAFGGVILAGSVITQLVFHYAAASVWCFFAALASLFVFLHVRRRKRLREA